MWQCDLENTKERHLHKPSQDQSKSTALGGVWNFAERCIACCWICMQCMSSLADPGGRTRPPLTAADLWFFMSKTLVLLIFLSILWIEIRPKHTCKWLLLQPLTLSMIFYPPPPLTKSTPPAKNNTKPGWLRSFAELCIWL